MPLVAEAVTCIVLRIDHGDEVEHNTHAHNSSYHHKHPFMEQQQDDAYGKHELIQFYLENAGGMPAHLDEIVVDGGEDGAAAAYAKQLEIGNGIPPCRLEQQVEKGRSHHDTSYQEGKGQERCEAYALPIDLQQAFPVLLYTAEYGVGGILYAAIHQTHDRVANLVALRKQSELTLGIESWNNQ